MKYKPSLIGDMSGSLGAITASHNQYGQYLRTRVKPVQPRTIGQQDQRLAFGAVSQIWRTLDGTARNTWIAQAPQFRIQSSTGNQITPSGQALYMYINVLRQRLGLTLNTVPPPTPEPAPITPVTITLAANNKVSVAFTASDPWHAEGGAALVSISPPITPGVSYMQTFTPLGVITAADTSPVEFNLPFIPGELDNLKVRVSASSPNGRRSTLAYSWLYPPVTDQVVDIVDVTAGNEEGDPITVTISPDGQLPGPVVIDVETQTQGTQTFRGNYASGDVLSLEPDDPTAATNTGDAWTLVTAPYDWIRPKSGQLL